jgi:hypothetical protein
LQSGNWWVGISNGSNGFTTNLWTNWNPNVTWVDVHVGDFNGDGKDDMMLAKWQRSEHACNDLLTDQAEAAGLQWPRSAYGLVVWDQKIRKEKKFFRRRALREGSQETRYPQQGGESGFNPRHDLLLRNADRLRGDPGDDLFQHAVLDRV